MIRWLACALLCLGACAQPVRLSSTDQLVIVIDEDGQPVRGASVELRNHSYYDENRLDRDPDYLARTNRAGIARFQHLTSGPYFCDAHLEFRASVAQGGDFIEYYSMPGNPVVLTLQELHLGGLNAPGLRWIAFREGRGNGFHLFDLFGKGSYPDYVNEVATALSIKYPEAKVLGGSGRRPWNENAVDWIEAYAEWYGYQPTRWQILMEPASRFRGPRMVRPEDLQPCAWTEVPIRLKEPGDADLPSATRDAILKRSSVSRAPPLSGIDQRYSPALSAGEVWRVVAPCGAYRFQWLDSDWRWPEYLTSFDLTVDTTEIVVILPEVVRLVRVHVEGPPGGFHLIPQYESGTESAVWSDQDDYADLILPLGKWELELHYYYSDHGFERFTRSITVEDVDAQDLVWNVTRSVPIVK